MYNSGYRFHYDSHGADSGLNERTGQIAEIVRPLTNNEADLEETGPMYKIRFIEDNFETDIFEDEIEPPLEIKSYDHVRSQMQDFDELYSDACRFVRNCIVHHFAKTDNWTNEQVESITGRTIYNPDIHEISEEDKVKYTIYTKENGDFDWASYEDDNGLIAVDGGFSEEIDDLLMTNSDFDLQTMIAYAKDFNINLTGLEVPYKIIILADGENTSLDDYDKVQSMLVNEESIPADMFYEYIVCRNKEELCEKWEENLERYEGCWYGVKDGEGLLLGGSYDPNDIEDIELYPTFISEYEVINSVKGYLTLEQNYGGSLNNPDAINIMWDSADLGECRDADSECLPYSSGTLRVTGKHTIIVQAYSDMEAIAKAQEAFENADFGELSGIELVKTTIVDRRAHQQPDKYELAADDLISRAQHQSNAILGTASFSTKINGRNYACFLKEDIKDVFEIEIRTNVGTSRSKGEIIGKVYDLCGKNEVAVALKEIDAGTREITSMKGKRMTLNKILDKQDKEKSE